MTHQNQDHFIDGICAVPAAGAYIDGFDPITGEVNRRVALGDSTDVDRAVAAAAKALPAWRDMRPSARGRILVDIGRRIRERAGDFAAIERRETGKALPMARFEIEGAAQYFEFYGGLVNAIHGETINIGAGYHSYTRREPFGVVGAILPWNAPMNQAGRSCAPALAAGNTVVAKPSECTPGTILKIAQMAVEECGLPRGVFNVVLGMGKGAGEPLVSHKDVRKVAFTGSLRAGQEIGRIASQRILPLTLELGGKSPNIVFADADFDAAIAGVLKGFLTHAGQVCLAGTRVLVERSIHDRFVEALASAVTRQPIGTDDSVVGPMTTHAQFEKVQSYYEIARSEGAMAVAGGKLPSDERLAKGWFVSPTLYTNVTTDMRIYREEVFGPVAVVVPFEDEAQAIAIANDTEFGLAAGIWTRDLARAHRVAAQVEAGQIYVNEYMAGGVETPLGGYKLSGYGRERGLESLHHYTQLKCVTVKL